MHKFAWVLGILMLVVAGIVAHQQGFLGSSSLKGEVGDCLDAGGGAGLCDSSPSSSSDAIASDDGSTGDDTGGGGGTTGGSAPSSSPACGNTSSLVCSGSCPDGQSCYQVGLACKCQTTCESKTKDVPANAPYDELNIAASNTATSLARLKARFTRDCEQGTPIEPDACDSGCKMPTRLPGDPPNPRNTVNISYEDCFLNSPRGSRYTCRVNGSCIGTRTCISTSTQTSGGFGGMH